MYGGNVRLLITDRQYPRYFLVAMAMCNVIENFDLAL